MIMRTIFILLLLVGNIACDNEEYERQYNRAAVDLERCEHALENAAPWVTQNLRNLLRDLRRERNILHMCGRLARQYGESVVMCANTDLSEEERSIFCSRVTHYESRCSVYRESQPPRW